MDDELIRWCALATRAACSPDDRAAAEGAAGQRRAGPEPAGPVAWDHKATAHPQVFNLLADAITDRPVPALFLNRAVEVMYDLMVTVMEQHLRRLHFMWRLSRSSETGGIAV